MLRRMRMLIPPKCPKGGRCKIRKRMAAASVTGKFRVTRRRICIKCGRLYEST